MAASRTQIIALVALVSGLAGLLSYQSRQDLTPGARLDAGAGSGAATGAASQRTLAKAVPPVALDRLTQDAPEPSDTGRDPFRFGAKTAAAGRGGVGSAPAPVTPAPVVRPVEPAGPTGPPPPPPPPPITMKFIGLITKHSGGKVAMLSDGRGVYYGIEGSIVEGQYRLIRIGTDSIEMSYLDGRGRKTIPLSGS